MDRELLLELKSFLAERMVDNMSTEDLAEYVQDDLFTYFDKQGEHDFLDEAENYWGEHLGEVIDEIQDYMKCDFNLFLTKGKIFEKMAQKKNTGNPYNNESDLFRALTRLFSGPIVNRRTQTGRQLRRRHLDIYSKWFKSARKR